jgi:hypothetical protein
VLDLLVGNRHHVAALDVDPGAVGHQALKAAGPGERRSRPPAHGGPVAVGGQIQNLEAEVRERVEQRAEVLADAVRRDEVLLADEPVDRARSPAVDRGIEVVIGQRLEVSLGYV